MSIYAHGNLGKLVFKLSYWSVHVTWKSTCFLVGQYMLHIHICLFQTQWMSELSGVSLPSQSLRLTGGPRILMVMLTWSSVLQT